MRRASIALAVALMWPSAPLRAQTPSVSARLEPDHLAAGDLTVLQITIAASVRIKGSPDLALQNFRVEAGPSLESRFEWINGRSASQTILVYRLRAIKPGPATVGPIRLVDSSGRTLEAPQVKATVEKSAESTGPERAAPVSTDPALVARLDPPRPFAGQQTVWTLYLVTRGRATQGEVKSLPDFKGFWAEDLDREQNVSPQLWNVAGVPWRAYPLIRKALFANRGGAIPIGAARAILAIRSEIFDIFGESPFADPRPVERESAPISADFRPLPEGSGRLPVGGFTLKVSADRPEVPPGGSCTVTAALTGDGRLADVPAPELALAGARISEPEARLSIRRGASKLMSTRIWQWVVTPEKPGDLTIPPLRITTFNPGPGRVAEVLSAPLTLHAAGIPTSPPAPLPAPMPEKRVDRPFPAFSVIVPLAAVLAFLLVAIGYRLGRSRGGIPAPARLEGPPEERVGRLLEALDARAHRRGGAAPGQVARLRDELARVAYSPQISSREEALEHLEAESRRLARRWRVRL